MTPDFAKLYEGFLLIANGMHAIPGVLVNEAVTVTALAGITGSASGGTAWVDSLPP